MSFLFFFFFSSRRRHTRYWRDWSSDVCSSDLGEATGREPAARAVPVRGPAVRPTAALALLAACVAAALLADHCISVLALTLVLLGVCLRAPRARRWPYLLGTLTSALGVFLLSPLAAAIGSHPLWTGPTLPVIGPLD